MSRQFTLLISEKNGSWAGRKPLRSTHPTEEAAEEALVEYVRRKWDAEMGSEPPEDESDLVDEYFDSVLERYQIVEGKP